MMPPLALGSASIKFYCTRLCWRLVSPALWFSFLFTSLPCVQSKTLSGAPFSAANTDAFSSV